MTQFSTTARPKPFGLAATEDAAGLIDRMPPHDLAAEAGVLGSMIIDAERIGPCAMILRNSRAFFKEENAVIYDVLVELFEANSGVDAMILVATLKKKHLFEQVGGIEYIKELASAVPTSAHAEYYAAIVKEHAVVRGVINACTKTLRDCYESGDNAAVIVDRGESRFFDIAQEKTTSQAVSIANTLQDVCEQFDRHSGEHLAGLSSGFLELDNLTCGLQAGEMIVVAARPSVGKTAFALNIVEHVGVDLKKPCGVFSLEMSKQQLVQRMLCSRSGVDSQKLRRGMLSVQDRERLSRTVGDLSQAPVFLDDTPSLTMLDLRTKARRMKLQYDIGLLMVDYLQLMEVAERTENRQQEITKISRGIKAIARELNIPVLCLSQLNRSSETAERLPRTSDLRESGSIEQDADTVILLHREAVMHRGDQEWADSNPDKLNEAIVIVAKQRNGPCDNIKLTFLAGQTRFVNYSPGV